MAGKHQRGARGGAPRGTLTTRLGLPHLAGQRALVAALLVDALGTGLFLPFSLLYFQRVAGLALPAIGLALTVASLLTLPLTPLAGTLADRLGGRRPVIASQLVQALGFLGYLAVGGIPTLLVTTLLVAAGGRVFFAASAALVAEVAAPAERDRWYGFVGATRNMGLGGGGLLAGLVLALGGGGDGGGYRALLVANVLSFLLTAALLGRAMPEPPRPGDAPPRADGYRAVLADRPFLGFAACNVLFFLCALILPTGLPLYATAALGVPTAFVGPLFALNTLLIVGAQTALVRALEPYRRTRVLAAAALVWAVGSGLFALALALPRALIAPALVGAVAVHTLGALLYAPTAPALVAAAGPAALRGRYLATYELALGLASALAPAAFTGFYAVGPAWPWGVGAALALAAGGAVMWLEPRLPARAARGH